MSVSNIPQTVDTFQNNVHVEGHRAHCVQETVKNFSLRTGVLIKALPVRCSGGTMTCAGTIVFRNMIPFS